MCKFDHSYSNKQSLKVLRRGNSTEAPRSKRNPSMSSPDDEEELVVLEADTKKSRFAAPPLIAQLCEKLLPCTTSHGPLKKRPPPAPAIRMCGSASMRTQSTHIHPTFATS